MSPAATRWRRALVLLSLCGGSARAATTRDPALQLSTVPRRVIKTTDSDKYGTETWFFDLVLVDERRRALEPVRATIELMSKGAVLKRLVLERGGLQSIRHARYVLNDKAPKTSPRRHFSLPEAFDLGLYFTEPRSAGVDSVKVALTVTDGTGQPLTQELGVALSTYTPKTSLIFPLEGPAIVTQGRYNQGGHVNRSTMYAMDIMGVSATSYGPMLRAADSADAMVGWGANILAPAAGVVTYARNDVPTNRSLYHPDVDVFSALPDPVWAGNGNCVVIDHGNGEFSALLHMQPGSVTVKPGDRVTQGQVIGRLGNSGDSNMPHLHYQLMDGPIMFVADGLPFTFANLTETTFAPGTFLSPRSPR